MNRLKVFTEVIYDEGCPQARLDLFRPLAGDRLPMVSLIHGGGWSGGTKESYWPVCIWLAEQGWAALTIEYRLYPEVRWPDILLDSVRASAYVSERAEQFGIDPTATVTWGSSAGGHLALLFQASYHPYFAGVSSNQGTIAAFNNRICHHHNTGLLDGLPDAVHRFSMFQLVDRFQKVFADACLCGSYKITIFCENEPGAMISPVFNKIVTGALYHLFPVFYPYNKLVDVADGPKDGVEVDNALLCLLACFYFLL